MASEPSNKKKSRSYREASKCRPCAGGIDYKNLDALTKMVSQQGKLYSRKRSGLCAKCQRSAREAIKRARMMALMPFVG